jgi:hypothetical protein
MRAEQWRHNAILYGSLLLSCISSNLQCSAFAATPCPTAGVAAFFCLVSVQLPAGLLLFAGQHSQHGIRDVPSAILQNPAAQTSLSRELVQHDALQRFSVYW